MPIFAVDWRPGHPLPPLFPMCELQAGGRIQPCPYPVWGRAFPPWALLLYPFQKGKGMRDGLLPLSLITSSLLMFLFSPLAQACSADTSYNFFQIVWWTRINPVFLTHVYLGEIVDCISGLKQVLAFPKCCFPIPIPKKRLFSHLYFFV